jgi:hypothetical protein
VDGSALGSTKKSGCIRHAGESDSTAICLLQGILVGRCVSEVQAAFVTTPANMYGADGMGKTVQ